ncbi:class A sortase [Lacticaseibacillus parakribbianus]|uniref:class A sortase n=1 Tax=Lacticaseibacillus parakribbianus TaxID=2970927 RepID=UPI0021CB12DE|nr:class A sortase [Lacticaseibacillus parakribbianus]
MSKKRNQSGPERAALPPTSSRRPRRRWWVQALASVLLLTAGLALAAYVFQDQLTAALIRRNRVAVTTATVTQAKRRATTTTPSYDFARVKPLSLAGLSQAALAQHAVAAVGKLVVPDVGMNLPIALGVGDNVLAFAAGTLTANQVMGHSNYALAGHHVHTDEALLFGPLVRTRVGTQVFVTDMTRVYAYQIYARTYIRATQVGVLNPTKQPELTLVTCDDDGTGRLVIQARLIGETTVAKAPQSLQKAIAKND